MNELERWIWKFFFSTILKILKLYLIAQLYEVLTLNYIYIFSFTGASNSQAKSHEIKQLTKAMDETDRGLRSPPTVRGRDTPPAVAARDRDRQESQHSDTRRDKWECGTCTYLNQKTTAACEMCGKSKRGPEIQPLTSGGRECPACTLVNQRDASLCDACGTSLHHCPTYI